VKIEIAKALHGDCIWLTWTDFTGSTRNMLVDTGVPATFATFLNAKMKSVETIDALVLTHIDEDHISGFLKYLARVSQFDLKVGAYIINKPDGILYGAPERKKSLKQAHNVMLELEKRCEVDRCHNASFENPGIMSDFHNMQIELFSPNQIDLTALDKKWEQTIECENATDSKKRSIEPVAPEVTLEELAMADDCIISTLTNDCSIAFLAKDHENSIFLLGDSNPRIVASNLIQKGYTPDKRVKADYVKLSHHGSKNNISKELISLIDCSNFIISTNGGSGQTKHPDRETIAKIVHAVGRDKENPLTFWFNYPKESIELRNGLICTSDEEQLHNFACKTIKEGEVLN
jgi:beta-lactamase superfamily II metal-dependent hydrolase